MFLNIVYASGGSPGVTEATVFVAKFNEIILYPLIILLTAVAVLVFMYGSFQFIAHAENSTAREDGRKHILWGIIGLLVMLIAFTILSVAANTFGVKDVLDCAKDPTLSHCNNTVFELPAIVPTYTTPTSGPQ